jgi:hypothetical protein
MLTNSRLFGTNTSDAGTFRSLLREPKGRTWFELFVRRVRCKVGMHDDLEKAFPVFPDDLQPPVSIGAQLAIQIAEAVACVACRCLPGGGTIAQMFTDIVDVFGVLAIENIEKVPRHTG